MSKSNNQEEREVSSIMDGQAGSCCCSQLCGSNYGVHPVELGNPTTSCFNLSPQILMQAEGGDLLPSMGIDKIDFLPIV
ncbi:unnamed protein product [Sphagnum troendelagicum]|uniref:Uncharacterized protein n=1 Tax=Sphagnum troendelagicum TaxID=128251 RepID=A0ABP0UKN0_9BRYO